MGELDGSGTTIIIDLFHNSPFPLLGRGIKGEVNKQKNELWKRSIVTMLFAPNRFKKGWATIAMEPFACYIKKIGKKVLCMSQQGRIFD
jgi:hypothetical protein